MKILIHEKREETQVFVTNSWKFYQINDEVEALTDLFDRAKKQGLECRLENGNLLINGEKDTHSFEYVVLEKGSFNDIEF